MKSNSAEYGLNGAGVLRDGRKTGGRIDEALKWKRTKLRTELGIQKQIAQAKYMMEYPCSILFLLYGLVLTGR